VEGLCAHGNEHVSSLDKRLADFQEDYVQWSE
jgi:hypothetical protein